MYSIPVYSINEQDYEKTYQEQIVPVSKESDEDKNSLNLQCGICGLILSNKWNLTLHMRVHNNDRRYKCNDCSSSFITAYELKKHLLVHTGMKPRYYCQFCPKSYASRHSRNLHEDSHNKSEYKCRHCPEIFSKFNERKKHEKDFHINNDLFFNCSECNKKFTSQRFLEIHEKNYHKKDKGWFKCEECGKLFKTSVMLNVHRRTHTSDKIVINIPKASVKSQKIIKKKVPIEFLGIKIHECLICTKRYASRGDMLRHMSNSHPEENKSIFKYSCNICDKSFKCKQGLSQHLITHNGDKKFSCSFCDYKSKRSADLQVHMRKHTGEAPYSCDKCGRRFQHIKSFQYHKKQHFGKAFSCNHCDASFYRNKELEWHKKKHSYGGYECHKCGKLLANPYSLKYHLKIGKCLTREKSKAKSSSRSIELLNKAEKDSKCYECFVCGFSSISELDMIQHQAMHEICKSATTLEEEESELEDQRHTTDLKRINKLKKGLNSKVERIDFKGIISVHKPYKESYSYSPVEEMLKLPGTGDLFNSNVCTNIEALKMEEKIKYINGKTFLCVDSIKHFDNESLSQFIKLIFKKH